MRTLEVFVDNVLRATDEYLDCDIGDEEVRIPRSILQPGTDIEYERDCGFAVVPYAWAEKQELI